MRNNKIHAVNFKDVKPLVQVNIREDEPKKKKKVDILDDLIMGCLI